MSKRIQRAAKPKKIVRQSNKHTSELNDALAQEHDRTLSEYTATESLPDTLDDSTVNVLVERPTHGSSAIDTAKNLAQADETPHSTHDNDASLAEHKTFHSPRKRHWIRWTIAVILLGLLIAGGAYGFSLYSIIRNSITDKDSQHSAIEQIIRIVDKNVEKIKGEADDRVNILLLGMGGENYPGGTLTDTVMIASIQPSTHRVALISIPRDLVVPIPPENLATAEYLKINSVLVHGDIDMEYKIIKLLTGLDIHYHVLADFDGFTDVIDAVDGITVNVESAFQGYYGTDQLNAPCPASDRRLLDDGPYCLESFSAGTQEMDGYTALMYSRIRKVPSTSQHEGGDYARAARQQKVIQAFKEKILSAGTLLNPSTIANLLTTIGDHMSTNMEIWEMLRIAEMAKDVTQEDISNVVLDTDPETGVLVEAHSNTTGAFYQQPKAGLTKYEEIHALIEKALNPLTVEEKNEASNTNTSSSTSEYNFNINIQNASGTTGIAAKAQEILSNKGFTYTTIGNALNRNQATSRIYDISGGSASEVISLLEDTFGVTAQTASIPTRSSVRLSTDIDPRIVDLSQLDETTDIVILLGQDQTDLSQ